MDNPPDSEILPGMTATVVWTPPSAGSRSGDTVPLAAVLGQEGSGTWVFVIDPETMTAQRRSIRIGAIRAGDQVEVLEGLEPGEIVAAAGVYHLEDGMRVRAFGS